MSIADIFPFLNELTVEGIIKIPLLLLLFVYLVFAVILFNKARSLGKLIFLEASIATLLLDALAFFHILAAVLLFLLALVIL
ncbi:MAG: hypothetical protein Q8Q49_03330 [bacterium]|nr:hypothetical protein [bacterium]